MAETTRIQAEDVLPVRSRLSWGALFAGAFVTLALYVLLSVLGTALGLSLAGHARGETIAIGAAAWAIATMLVALFAGGCVATRCSAGETKTEAVIYGVVLWGVMLAAMIFASGAVMRAGFGGLMRGADVAADTNWERAARDAKVGEAQINQIRANLPSQAEVQARSEEAAWWTLGGLAASLLASIAGAVSGSGAVPYFNAILVRRTAVFHAAGPAAQPR